MKSQNYDIKKAYSSKKEPVINVSVTHPRNLTNALNSVKSFLNILYNKENKTVIGRDGMSWIKVSLCYFLFYAVLGSTFIAFIAIFAATLDKNEPRYYADNSVMSTRNNINPGLGFRPQIDVEDMLISYSIRSPSLNNIDNNLQHLTKALNIYLEKYYDNKTKENEIDCNYFEIDKIREQFKRNKKHCKYDYKHLLSGTNCDPKNNFGYAEGPCIAVKLNRIFTWIPISYEDEKEISEVLNETVRNLPNKQELIKQNIFVKCEGEFSADIDIFQKVRLIYYSVSSFDSNVLSNINQVGLIPLYYFPFLNQPGYRSPLVFVQFRNLPSNVLVNVLCKAYAKNVDTSDKTNLRGMVRFQVFVEK